MNFFGVDFDVKIVEIVVFVLLEVLEVTVLTNTNTIVPERHSQPINGLEKGFKRDLMKLRFLCFSAVVAFKNS